MSRIEVAPRYRCDRCGEVFAGDDHHGWMVVKKGFGDVSKSKSGKAADLCDRCTREALDFIDEEIQF